MKDLVDSHIREIESMTNQILWDRQIRFYLKTNEPDREFRKIIENQIKEIRFLNKYIDQIYIVNENMGLREAGRIIPENHQATVMDWVEISKNSRQPLLYEDLDGSRDGKELYLIRRFFMMDGSDTSIYLVVCLNPSLLEESLSRIEWIDKGAGFVLDNHGVVLSSVVNIDLDESLDVDVEAFLSEHRGVDAKFEIQKDDYVLSLLKSDVWDLYFTIILPETVYYGKLKRFQTMTTMSLFVCLAAGILLSFLFTRKRYIPVLALVNLFSNKSLDKLSQNGASEFEILEEEIKSVLSENTSVKEMFLKNRQGLKRVFFRRLVMGEDIDTSILLDMAGTIGIDFTYENFVVLIFDAVDGGERSFLKLKNELEKKSSLLEEEHHCYLLTYSGRNIGILNIENSDNYSDLEIRLGVLMRFLRDDMTEQFILTAGKIYNSVTEITISYSEALQVLDYRTTLGDKKILLYNELRELKRDRDFHYLSFLGDEYKIYNMLTAGKYENARSLLKEGLDAIEESYVDVEILKIRLAGFKNILIESLNAVLHGRGDHLMRLVKRIIGSSSFYQLKNNLDFVIDELIRLSPEKSRSDLVVSAREYMDKHFMNKDLSVADVAENLNITPQYLSKIFKEINGSGPLQYINGRRIEEAKEILINEPDISIKDTGGLVGYYSEITFIRNFKNVTGLSPGRFRKTQSA
jgi:AraC-like DNA-binding protein